MEFSINTSIGHEGELTKIYTRKELFLNLSA